MAEEHTLSSVAFPAISCGIYGYPAEQAARIAVDQLQSHQPGAVQTTDLVAFDGEMLRVLQQATEV